MRTRLLKKLRKSHYIKYDRDMKTYNVYTHEGLTYGIKTIEEARECRDEALLEKLRYKYYRNKRYKRVV